MSLFHLEGVGLQSSSLKKVYDCLSLAATRDKMLCMEVLSVHFCVNVYFSLTFFSYLRLDFNT